MNEGIIGGVLADTDTLMILALAYILYTQKADKALILALLSIVLM